MENEKYYTVRNKYLAEGMAFLGYRYMKFGHGKESEYSFGDTENFRSALTGLIELKEKVGQYRE